MLNWFKRNKKDRKVDFLLAGGRINEVIPQCEICGSTNVISKNRLICHSCRREEIEEKENQLNLVSNNDRWFKVQSELSRMAWQKIIDENNKIGKEQEPMTETIYDVVDVKNEDGNYYVQYRCKVCGWIKNDYFKHECNGLKEEPKPQAPTQDASMVEFIKNHLSKILESYNHSKNENLYIKGRNETAFYLYHYIIAEEQRRAESTCSVKEAPLSFYEEKKEPVKTKPHDFGSVPIAIPPYDGLYPSWESRCRICGKFAKDLDDEQMKECKGKDCESCKEKDIEIKNLGEKECNSRMRDAANKIVITESEEIAALKSNIIALEKKLFECADNSWGSACKYNDAVSSVITMQDTVITLKKDIKEKDNEIEELKIQLAERNTEFFYQLNVRDTMLEDLKAAKIKGRGQTGATPVSARDNLAKSADK